MEWNIVKNTGECGKCRKTLQEEEVIYSCLLLETNAFSRTDFCENCWENTSDAPFFSFWKTNVPQKNIPRQKLIDNAAMLNLFLRLGENEKYHDEPWAKNMRYVLALFLMRKKLLKLEKQGSDDLGEFMELYSVEEDKLFKMHTPKLSEEEVMRLNDEIMKLFDPSTAGQSIVFELTKDPAAPA
ncbi:MAG: hypothetical protein NOU37_00525 [Candidatus Brocadiales bacterium]|nr:hypothetical protein [Candidatus Bathyanammoxibius amoris]